MSTALSPTQARPRSPSKGGHGTLVAWGFIAPALLFYATFVLVPIVISLWYSLLRWDGIGKWQFKGLSNYLVVLSEV